MMQTQRMMLRKQVLQEYSADNVDRLCSVIMTSPNPLSEWCMRRDSDADISTILSPRGELPVPPRKRPEASWNRSSVKMPERGRSLPPANDRRSMRRSTEISTKAITRERSNARECAIAEIKNEPRVLRASSEYTGTIQKQVERAYTRPTRKPNAHAVPPRSGLSATMGRAKVDLLEGVQMSESAYEQPNQRKEALVPPHVPPRSNRGLLQKVQRVEGGDEGGHDGVSGGASDRSRSAVELFQDDLLDDESGEQSLDSEYEFDDDDEDDEDDVEGDCENEMDTDSSYSEGTRSCDATVYDVSGDEAFGLPGGRPYGLSVDLGLGVGGGMGYAMADVDFDAIADDVLDEDDIDDGEFLLSETTQERATSQDSENTEAAMQSDVMEKSDDLLTATFLRYGAAGQDITDQKQSDNWNERFQFILNTLWQLESGRSKLIPKQANSHSSKVLQSNLGLIALAKDFLHTAKVYGKIIISEVFLPYQQKTIKPADVGGVAGGSKYIVQDILFKFALDTRGIYGRNNAAAATVAGHELKGLQAYFDCGLHDVAVPLMALVDYRGFRLIAISLLPISGDTIVMGSHDGGHTVHNDDTVLAGLMQRAATTLNIKPHPAGLDPDNRTMVYTAADVEGHRSEDNDYYLIDFARVFPCETPQKYVIPPSEYYRGENLTNLFRPEFVKAYKTPLCSDAYSGFASTEYNADIDEASLYLQWNVIPEFAQALPSLFEKHVAHVSSFSAGKVLNNIAESAAKSNCRALLLMEMVARVAKNDLRKRMRIMLNQVKRPLEQPFRNLVINYLNLVLGDSSISNDFWANHLQPAMVQKFNGLAIHTAKRSFKEMAVEMASNFEGCNWQFFLLWRLKGMLGIELNTDAERDLQENVDNRWSTAEPLLPSYLVDIGLRIKCMDIISQAEGQVFLMHGLQARAQCNSRSAISFFQSAVDAFESVLNSNPHKVSSLRACASALTLLEEERSFGSEGTGVLQCTPTLQKAIGYLNSSRSLAPDDPRTILMQAVLHGKMGKVQDAERYYIKTLLQAPGYSAAIISYCHFLCKIGEYDDGEALRAAYVKLEKHRASAIHEQSRPAAGAPSKKALRNSTVYKSIKMRSNQVLNRKRRDMRDVFG